MSNSFIFDLCTLLDVYDPLDRPVSVMQRLIECIHKEYTVILISSRPTSEREEVEQWLDKWHIPFDKMYLKHDEYIGTDIEYKLTMIDKIQSIGYHIEGYLECDHYTAVQIGAIGGLGVIHTKIY